MTRNLTPADTPSPADWLVHSEQGPPVRVGSFVTAAFPAVARVLNPLTGTSGRRVPWSAAARELGVEVDGSTVAERLCLAHAALGGEQLTVDFGTLGRGVAAALAEVLGRHTATGEECYFATWAGYADLRDDLASAPRVVLPPDREMLLIRGPVQAAAEPVDEHGARRSLRWWPADRAWCVGNDLYADSVYVAGSADCIAGILADPRLEAIAVGSLDPHPGTYA